MLKACIFQVYKSTINGYNILKTMYWNVNLYIFACTVKPVFKDHWWGHLSNKTLLLGMWTYILYIYIYIYVYMYVCIYYTYTSIYVYYICNSYIVMSEWVHTENTDLCLQQLPLPSIVYATCSHNWWPQIIMWSNLRTFPDPIPKYQTQTLHQNMVVNCYAFFLPEKTRMGQDLNWNTICTAQC